MGLPEIGGDMARRFAHDLERADHRSKGATTIGQCLHVGNVFYELDGRFCVLENIAQVIGKVPIPDHTAMASAKTR